MNFQEYKESVIECTEDSKDLLYALAYIWLHPSRLPLKVVGLGNCCDGVIKIPNWSDETRVVQFDSGPEKFHGGSVPIIGFSRRVFKDNLHVTDIILQSNIERIPDEAFSGCTALERITIPKNVKRIGKEVFKNCGKLKDIYYEGTEDEWNMVDIVYKGLRPVNSKQLGLIVDMEEYIIPGNGAVFSANIHYNCKFCEESVPQLSISDGKKDVTDFFRTKTDK